MTRWPGAMRAGRTSAGVDLIQNCEVTGIDIENGVVRGVQTTRGRDPGEEGGDHRGGAVVPGRGDGGDAVAD